MEIALSALVIGYLLAPGIAWRFSFWASPHAESRGPEEYAPLARPTLRIVLAALVAQAIGVALIQLFTQYDTSFAADVIALISGSATHQSQTLDRLLESADLVVAYGVAITFGTWLSGRVLRWLVTRLRLDDPSRPVIGRFARWARFDTPWTELLLNYSPRLSFKMAYAVVEIGGEAYVYAGVVEKLHFNRDGALDRLLLSGAERWKFSDDSGDEETAHDDLSLGQVVLPYSRIQNLYVVDIIEEPTE
jgi:hypothetical protein